MQHHYSKQWSGWCIQKLRRQWIMGYAARRNYENPTSMELCAVLEGLRIALQYRLMPLETHVDSTKVINMLQNHNLQYSSILHECRSLLHQLGKPRVSYTFRELNQVADKLAKHCTTLEVGNATTMFLHPPTFLLPEMTTSQTGTLQLRRFSTHHDTDPPFFYLNFPFNACNSSEHYVSPVLASFCNLEPSGPTNPCNVT